MKQLFKSNLIRVLALARAYPTRMTDRRELHSLLKKLYPVSTAKELVRFGPRGDGGYLVPNDFKGICACFSPGVSTVSGFERDCANLGMNVFLADKSVDRPAEKHELFHFTKKYIGAISNDDFITLDSWVASATSADHFDLILQIDIEGYEYEVFLSASETLMQRFRIIVAEFHQLHQLWNKPFFGVASRAFDKILQTHACVHIHPNNRCGYLKKDGIHLPKTMEFTFLRKDRIDLSSYQQNFPNQLDCDNTKKSPSLTLPRCWHNGR
jgi:hypothetical protein